MNFQAMKILSSDNLRLLSQNQNNQPLLTITNSQIITIRTRKLTLMVKAEAVINLAGETRIIEIEITTVKMVKAIRISVNNMVVAKAEKETIVVKTEVGIAETNGMMVFQTRVVTKLISTSKIGTKGTKEKKEVVTTTRATVASSVSTSKSLISQKSTQTQTIACITAMTHNFSLKCWKRKKGLTPLKFTHSQTSSAKEASQTLNKLEVKLKTKSVNFYRNLTLKIFVMEGYQALIRMIKV
jgi:hypothetical protein